MGSGNSRYNFQNSIVPDDFIHRSGFATGVFFLRIPRDSAPHVRLLWKSAGLYWQTMIKWLCVFIASTALGLVFVTFRHESTLEPFKGTFLGTAFAVATFSIAFCMAVFNASSYRQFHRGFPARLLWSCLGVLAIALVPLSVLAIRPEAFIPICLLVLPPLTVAGAFLLEVARRETDPVILVERLCSIRKVNKHLHSLVPKLDARISETKALELSRVEDRPTHEFDWHLPLPLRRDEPLNHLATLGLLAIEHDDLYAFKCVVARAFEALTVAENFAPKKTTVGEYRIREELRNYLFDVLERITLGLQQNKGTVSLAKVAIDVLAEFAVEQTKQHKQTQRVTFSALYLMETLGRHCYESGSKSEVRIPIIVARQLVQKGIDNPPTSPADKEVPMDVWEFHQDLPQLTDCIKRLGSYAISKKDAEFVYRCFDAFAWLGCSAVKRRHVTTVSACLRALAQLGREARAERLECFWSRCPVRPEDHAAERIGWIASWLARIPDDERKHLTALCECAYGRLLGRDTTLTFRNDSNGEISIERYHSDKKHTESYLMQAAARDVDYSDFTFLKDLEMFAGKGVLAEGPPVPLQRSA